MADVVGFVGLRGILIKNFKLESKESYILKYRIQGFLIGVMVSMILFNGFVYASQKNDEFAYIMTE